MIHHSLRLPVGPGSDREELRITGDPELIALVRALAASLVTGPATRSFASILAASLATIEDAAGRDAAVLDAMMPPVGTMSDAGVTQLRWNALAREEALREFGAFSAADLATIRGARTTNPHTTTTRWLVSRRVFAIDTPAGRRFPAFQFVDGDPRPIIARIIAAMDGRLRGWELLAWFTGSMGFLDGGRPVDHLVTDPDGVVAAAAYQASLTED